MAKKEITPANAIEHGKDLQIIPTAATRELTPAIWRMIGEMAPVMYKAQLFGVT